MNGRKMQDLKPSAKNGKGAAQAGAIILLIVAAANIGYGVYRVTLGDELELSLMIAGIVCATLAAVLFSQTKAK